ncbi:hypothetical protein D3C72_2520650 [compost metagenome]
MMFPWSVGPQARDHIGAGFEFFHLLQRQIVHDGAIDKHISFGRKERRQDAGDRA